MPLAFSLADMTEKVWQGQVMALARQLAWKSYHPYRSDKSQPGWPDIALVRDRLILLELKTEKGKLSDAQKDWIRRLTMANAEIYVARPRHLDELARVLQARNRSLVTDMEAETKAAVALP